MHLTGLTSQDLTAMGAIVGFVSTIIDILIWIIIISVILSWLIVLNVVDLSNRYVRMAYDLISRITDPLLNPIRRFMPNFGGIDISPIVLVLILVFIQYLLLSNPATAVVLLVATIFNIAMVIVAIAAVLTWMYTAGAINRSNHFVYMVYDSVSRMCDPLLNPIRGFLPRIGGYDLSFVIAFIALWLLKNLFLSFL